MWVIEPERGLQSLLANPRLGSNGWGTVYEHLGFLELTRRLVANPQHATVVVPDHNRGLVEMVYHTESQQALRAESDAWQEHFGQNGDRAVSHEIIATEVAIRFEQTYLGNAGCFQRDTATSIRTRLGDDRVRVLLPGELAGYYDQVRTVETVDLPFQEIQRAGLSATELREPVAAGGRRIGDCVHYELKGFQFAYGPQGWVWGEQLAGSEEPVRVVGRVRECLPDVPEDEVERDVAEALRAVRNDAVTDT